MIIPLPFIVSLLFTITYATDFDYKIDLDRCSVDTTCFVRQRCITATPAENPAPPPGTLPKAETVLVEFAEEKEKLNDGDCDAIIQVIWFTPRRYLVLMQITADAGLDEAKGVAMQQGGAADNDEQISCKKVNENIVHTLVPVPNEKNMNFEGTKASAFDATKLFCAVFASSEGKMPIYSHFTVVDDSDPFKNKYPSLVYTKDGVETRIKFADEGDNFWTKMETKKRCPLTKIKSTDLMDDNFDSTEVDLSQKSLKCPEGKKMTVFYHGPHDAPVVETAETEFLCEKTANGYAWSPAISNNGNTQILCVKTRFCSACGDTPPSSPEDCTQGICTATPTINTDSTTGCQTLTCPSTENEFTFDGKSTAKSDGPITCKKSATDPTKGGWFFKRHGDDPPTEYSKIACATIKSCDHNQFNFTCPEEIKEVCKKPDFDEAKFNFTCTQGYLQKGDGKGEALATVCDRSTGKWRDLEDTANIFCAPEAQTKSDANTGSETTSTGNIGATVGIALGVLIAVGAVVGSLYYVLVHKKKQDAKKTTKKEEGTSKKSSKKVESKSGGVGSSNEAKKEEKKSDPNKESEKPPADAAKEPAKDGKEAPKDGAEPPKETPKDAAATPAAGAATPAAPATPGAAAPATPAADSAPAPADATPV